MTTTTKSKLNPILTTAHCIPHRIFIVRNYALKRILFSTDKTLVPPDDDNLWKENDTKMKKYVVPQTWSFDENGNLKAFEYLASDTPMPNPPLAFVVELYAELKKLNIEKNLGIRRIENVLGRSSWESTPDGTRSNVVIFGKQPDTMKDNTVTVLWYFDDDGNLYKGAHCIQHCYHCYGHYD